MDKIIQPKGNKILNSQESEKVINTDLVSSPEIPDEKNVERKEIIESSGEMIDESNELEDDAKADAKDLEK